jgi:hypothetical protein
MLYEWRKYCFNYYCCRSSAGVNKMEDHFKNSIIFVGRQEEMLTGSNISPRKRSLEDLFRPPLDLMFHGTFQNVSYGL